MSRYFRVAISVNSPEIARASLHISRPWQTHLYGYPFLSLYPLLAYAYYVKYDQWLVSEEWTFLACVSLGVGHALSFLVTKWSAGARAFITTKKVCTLVPNVLSVLLCVVRRQILFKKPTAYVLCLTYTVVREISSKLRSVILQTLQPLHLITSGTHTPYPKRHPSPSPAYLIHHLADHLSQPFTSPMACSLASSNPFWGFMAQMSLTSPSLPSPNCSESTQLRHSLFSRFSASRCGVWMSIGTTACSLYSCWSYSSAL